MIEQPDFPTDEPVMPAHDCQCAICRGIALMVGAARQTLPSDAATAKPATSRGGLEGSTTPPRHIRNLFAWPPLFGGYLS